MSVAKIYKTITLILVFAVSGGRVHQAFAKYPPLPPLASKEFHCEYYKFKYQASIPPIAVFGITAAIQYTEWSKNLNVKIRDDLQKRNIHTKADDYLQYMPLASAFIIDAAGYHGKHHILDKFIISATAIVTELILVNTFKYSFGVLRPDGSSHNSFPSGHTATAFMGAEILRYEYGGRCVWIPVAGYVAAATTGYLRMQNNRHWLTDVLAGAAIGILSAQIAYYLYPYINKMFFYKNRRINKNRVYNTDI